MEMYVYTLFGLVSIEPDAVLNPKKKIFEEIQVQRVIRSYLHDVLYIETMYCMLSNVGTHYDCIIIAQC